MHVSLVSSLHFPFMKAWSRADITYTHSLSNSAKGHIDGGIQVYACIRTDVSTYIPWEKRRQRRAMRAFARVFDEAAAAAAPAVRVIGLPLPLLLLLLLRPAASGGR